MYRIIFAFFFASGFSSLVFEVLWERMLTQVFGNTSFALSTLLTAFMAGLALGSWLAGKIADRIDRPLRLYGALEGGIGLYALVVPLALDLLPTIYNTIFDHFLNDFYLFSLLRFAVAFAILIIPTTMMGATLPIVSQWISKRQRLFQGSIGTLYGINTVGACFGALLAGFLLLPNLGLSMTNTVFAVVNLALCATILGADALLTEQLEEPDGDLDETDDDPDSDSLEALEEEAAGVSRTA
ncbi:MAG: fused MFS/spermidine synthase, partial [Bradymonadaceae bacterium]